MSCMLEIAIELFRLPGYILEREKALELRTRIELLVREVESESSWVVAL